MSATAVSAAAATTPGDLAPLQIGLLHDAQAAGDRLEAIAERTGGGQSREAAERVDAILEQVRTQGDAALMELTERFDGVRPDPLRVPAEELAAAWAATPTALQEALPRYRYQVPVVVQYCTAVQQVPAGSCVNGTLETLV